MPITIVGAFKESVHEFSSFQTLGQVFTPFNLHVNWDDAIHPDNFTHIGYRIAHVAFTILKTLATLGVIATAILGLLSISGAISLNPWIIKGLAIATVTAYALQLSIAVVVRTTDIYFTKNSSLEDT